MAYGWLDEDGYHVWQQHDCVDGAEPEMLPYPTWRAKDGAIDPSVQCDGCGFHERIRLGERRG